MKMRKTQEWQTPANVAFAERKLYLLSKRAFDITLALLGLLAASLFMLVIAIAIRLDSPGPVLFRQVRLGKNGRPFTFYKFRSMRTDADPELHRRYVQSFIRSELPNTSKDDNPGQPPFKMKQDPRVTRVGHVLRHTSLDELPQLFNILKGEMSFVGPRPPVPYEAIEYQEWHKGRLAVVPGLTGLWQVNGRSRVSFDEMVRMDLAYIDRQSFWLDLKIIALTVPAVISGRGAG
jgi:exopolysaccharide biosynthesis polyprenyl glycosylphosphotransferase